MKNGGKAQICACTQKKTIKIKKTLAKAFLLRYTTNCCDMIAMKREVAACVHENIWQVFRGANVKLGNWRQVTVPKARPYGHPYYENVLCFL